MPPTQDSQTTFKPNLTYIFLSARYIISIPNGWPCITLPSGMIWQGTWTGWGECVDCPDGQVDQDIFTCVDCPNGQIEVDGVCKEGN